MKPVFYEKAQYPQYQPSQPVQLGQTYRLDRFGKVLITFLSWLPPRVRVQVGNKSQEYVHYEVHQNELMQTG